MAILLLLFLILLTGVAYVFGKRDLISPFFLFCISILAMYTVVLLNYKNWDVHINGKFVLYLVTAILSFGVGCFIVQGASGRVYGTERLPLTYVTFKETFPTDILIIVSFVCAGGYCLKLMTDAGLSGSLSGILRRIYDNIVNAQYSPGFIFNQMAEIVKAIAYISLYRLLIRLKSRHDRISIVKLTVPIVLFLLMTLISTDRNVLLRFIIYFVCLWVLLVQQNYKKRKVNKKIVATVLVFVVLAAIAFYIYGLAKQYKSNFLHSLSIYGGSGLYDFNLWIAEFDEPLLHGKATFSVFLGSLNSIFGLDIQGLENRFDAFITFTSPNGYVYSSNIYTAMKPFVQDFGYFGVILFPAVMGLLYQWLFTKAKKRKYSFYWVLYAMLLYPIIYFPILDQLFARFHLGFIYELVWLTVIYHLCIGKRKIGVGYGRAGRTISSGGTNVR